MRAGAKGIQEVFVDGRTLEVPFYQREYVWKEEQWCRFFEDVIDGFEKKMENPDSQINNFLGSIILQKKQPHSESEWEVIDGQQRLTTICLFYKALYLLINNNEAFDSIFRNRPNRDRVRLMKLFPNRNDKTAFDAIMEATGLYPITTLQTMSENIINGFKYFKNRLQALRDGQDLEHSFDDCSLEDLEEKSMEIIKLVQIEVEFNEDAQIIFEAINSLGQRLTTAELLKNYLYSKTDPDDYNSYKNGWKSIFESENRDYWHNDNTQGRTTEILIEIFLHRFLLVLVHHVDYKQMFTQNQLKYFRKKDGLYRKYKDVIDILSARIPEFGKLQFADMIVEYAQKYMQAFPKDILNEALVSNDSLRRLAFYMTATDSWTMTPYILYLLTNVQDPTELEHIFAHLETYLVRRIVCPSKNNNYSDLFSENLIGQNVNTAQAFLDYVSNPRERGSLLMPSDDKIRTDIQTHSLTAKEANILLYLLESKMNPTFTSLDRNTLEELIPVYLMPTDKKVLNPTDWPLPNGYNEERRDILNKTLGNVVLLEKKKYKKSYTNKKWIEKQSYILNNYAKDFETAIGQGTAKWDEFDIEQRNASLAELIIKAWPIDDTIDHTIDDTISDTVNHPAEGPLLTGQMRSFEDRNDGQNVSFENLYDDIEFEDGELQEAIQNFFNRYQRNGYLVAHDIQYVFEDDKDIYGHIYIGNDRYLPFIVHTYNKTVNNRRCSRLFTLNLISSDDLKMHNTKYFDAISDELYDQGVWRD
jgi:hypothetical protein